MTKYNRGEGYEENNGEIRRVHWAGNVLLRVSSKSRGIGIRRNNVVKIKIPPQRQFLQRPRGTRIAFSQRGISDSLSHEAGSKRSLKRD
jgi:hypothetical protein